MPTRLRSIISRLTLTVVAAALLWGSWVCFRTMYDIQHDRIRKDSAALPLLLGALLLIMGLTAAAGAVLPARLIERIFNRQRRTTLWDNPQPSSRFTHWSDWF